MWKPKHFYFGGDRNWVSWADYYKVIYGYGFKMVIIKTILMTITYEMKMTCWTGWNTRRVRERGFWPKSNIKNCDFK